MMYLSKAFLFVKKYWKIFAFIVGTIVALVLFKQRSANNIAEELKKMQEAHDAEILALENARKAEELERAANLKKLQDTLLIVKKQYEERQEELDKKKEREIKQIVDKYGDDPEQLAKQLSESTGFVVILPSEE